MRGLVFTPIEGGRLRDGSASGVDQVKVRLVVPRAIGNMPFPLCEVTS